MHNYGTGKAMIIEASIILCIVLITLRSIANLNKLRANLQWLETNSSLLLRKKPKTRFVLIIPLLREQGVLGRCLEYFSALNYPSKLYEIIIVTTEKEDHERKKTAKKAVELTSALLTHKSFSYIHSHFGDLFNEQILRRLIDNTINTERAEIWRLVTITLRNYKTTHELAVNLANEYNNRSGHPRITVLRYPHSTGVMSHQLNYALQHLWSNKKNLETFVAIYNADSHPARDTLLAADQQITQATETINILQQSSLFTLNYHAYPNTFSGLFLRSAALFQTKWTLVHELARLREQSLNVSKVGGTLSSIIMHSKLSHCVGHGLIVRLSYFVQDFLPTDTVTEDLPYGYYQCARGEAIFPIPVLENSDSPLSVPSLLNQKKIWFWPYIQYPQCYAKVVSAKQYRSKLEAGYLTLQGLIVGLAWLLHSAVFLLPIVLAPFSTRPLHAITLFLLAYLLYWIIPQSIIVGRLSKLEPHPTGRWSIYDTVTTSVLGILVILTHSIGPIQAIWDYLLHLFTGKSIVKTKTER
jgi:hypothetical protein